MRVITVDQQQPDSASIEDAATVIRAGGIVAYPTDTFYGLAVDPRNRDAVLRLFAVKGRPETSALTLIAADMEQARAAGEFAAAEAHLAGRWWPGPLTIVVPAHPALAREALAGGATVGLRVPDNAVARALARSAGFCVTATSANRSGAAPAASAADVAAALPGIDVVLDAGPSRADVPSTIVTWRDGQMTLVRAGAIAWDKVLESLRCV